MNTEFLVRMYFGGAAHRWQRAFGNGSGVGRTDSFGLLIASASSVESMGSACQLAPRITFCQTKCSRTERSIGWLERLEARCGRRVKGDIDANNRKSASEIISFAGPSCAADGSECPTVRVVGA